MFIGGLNWETTDRKFLLQFGRVFIGLFGLIQTEAATAAIALSSVLGRTDSLIEPSQNRYTTISHSSAKYMNALS